MKHMAKTHDGGTDNAWREIVKCTDGHAKFLEKNGWHYIDKGTYRHFLNGKAYYKHHESREVTTKCQGLARINRKGTIFRVPCQNEFKWHYRDGKVLPKGWREVPNPRKDYADPIMLCPDCENPVNYREENDGDNIKPDDAH